jgi:hypothetical protein
MSAILEEKTFPSQYPSDAVKVLKTMSFSNGKEIQIVGSKALRSQLYAGDYDAYEVVQGKFSSDTEAAAHYVKQFQTIIRNLKTLKNVYIGDIKAGVIEEWRVIPKTGSYTLRDAANKIDFLFQSKIASKEEAQIALAVLKPKPEALDILKAKDTIKFHIVRWTPEEVLKGYTHLRDGRKYTLEEAFLSPIITKLDVIALVQGKYTDFSIIYEFHNGSTPLNPDVIDPEQSLKNSIKLFQSQGNLFKVIKRKFALAKLKNDIPKVEKYNAILNSDLGKLYVIYADVKTLIELLEDHSIPRKNIISSIAAFKERLRKIYSLEDYLKSESAILTKLDMAVKSPRPLPVLKEIEEALLHHLSKATHLYGGELHY